MATKGASYRYGNTRGSKHQGQSTKHINYAWAKGFNRGGLDQHFKDHGKEFGAISKQDYAAKAVHFDLDWKIIILPQTPQNILFESGEPTLRL